MNDIFFISDLLEKLEIYAESACNDLDAETREHVAKTLEHLRAQHDKEIDNMRQRLYDKS